MASCYITARNTGRGRSYHVKYRRGGGAFPVEHGGVFPTKRSAEIRRSLILDWLAAGKNPQVELRRLVSPTRRVADLAAAWLAGRVDIDASTLVTYTTHTERVKDAFGKRPPEAVTPSDVVAFISSLKLAPGTVRQVVGVLRMILDEADLSANPARDRRIRLPRADTRVVEPPDAKRVLACFQHARLAHRATLVLLEQTGLRVSEALGLQPRDVDASGDRVRVRPEESKRDRPRWVPVPDWLGELLVLPLGGTRQAVYNAVKAGCEDAGVHHFRPHDLRHRRASLWHQQGIPAVELAARLGHARPSMSLDVYSHVMPLDEVPAHDLVLLLSSSSTSSR